MSEPKMTVLMPVYNAELFLREAIDSILQQTFRDFEFLIIDDGSTDSSIDIVASYSDPRIRFLKNERNMGISKTLNRGIELASCELIARMDSDDISYPKRLQKQYDYMKANPDCGLLSTWAREVTHDRQVVKTEKYHHEFYYFNLNFECWMYHPTIVFTKTAARKADMYSMPYSEDYDLFWKIAREYKIHNLGETLLDYRLSPTSLNTVLRKEEYAIAERENVIRNIRFYMGPEFEISEENLECLRHNFGPILRLNSIEAVTECLKILDAFTEAVINTPNVNLDVNAVRNAASFKRDFIINAIAFAWPWPKRIHLLMKERRMVLLRRKIMKGLQWRLRTIKGFFETEEQKQRNKLRNALKEAQP